MNSGRLEYIDIAKGLGIILVVVGHISPNKELNQLIYTFHMPLFFLIAGMFIRNKSRTKALVIKNFYRIIVPLIFFTFLFFPYQLFNLKITGDLTFKNTVAISPLFGGNGITTTFWFPEVLFMSLIIVHVLRKNVLKERSHIIILSLILLFFSHLITSISYLKYFPFSINVILYAIPLLLVGNLLTFFDFRKYKASVIFLMVIAIGIFLFGFNYKFDMKNNIYGVPVYAEFMAILLTSGILSVSIFLEDTKLGAAISYIGNASLVIMFLHQFIQVSLPISIPWIKIMLALIFSLIIYFFSKRHPVSNLLINGKRY